MKVVQGQVKCPGRLGSELGLVSPLVNMPKSFSRSVLFVFFGSETSAMESPPEGYRPLAALYILRSQNYLL